MGKRTQQRRQASAPARRSDARISRGTAFWLMGGLRIMYLLCIIALAFASRWEAVLFHGLIFAGSLFIPYLGRRDEQFYLLDIFVVLTFVISLLPSYFELWPRPTTIWEMTYSFDKIFHAAGGAGLGMFAAILLRRRTNDPLIFYGGIIIFALALGAAWEFFEWISSLLPGQVRIESAGYADSMLDLVADTLGATLVAIFLKVRRYL